MNASGTLGKIVGFVFMVVLLYLAIEIMPSVANPSQWTVPMVIGATVCIVLAVGIRRLAFS